MKKLLIIGIILLVAGTAWAQSNDAEVAPQGQPPAVTAEAPAQPPMNPIARAMMEARRRRQEAPQTAQGTETPSKQVQADKAASLSPADKSSVVPEADRNQLIRNLPYQPEKIAPVQTASSEPVRSADLHSPRLVVCVVNGFERSGMSSADCKAQNGREVTTAEVPRSDIGGKRR